jgi:hypothetical protein
MCDHLVELYDYFTRWEQKIDSFITKHKGHFSSPSPEEVVNDLYTKLGYPAETSFPLHEKKTPNRASKCYLVIMGPVAIVSFFSLLKAFFSFMFLHDTTLFFGEYVKLIPLVIPFLLLFVWILPTLFFKFIFPNETKHKSVYTNGIFISLLIPLLVIPQDYHHYKGYSVEIRGTVTKTNTHRKTRSITFLTDDKDLKKLTIRKLPEPTVKNAKKGEKYVIKGIKSRFYFTYDSITPIKDTHVHPLD